MGARTGDAAKGHWADAAVVVAPTVMIQDIDDEAVMLDTSSENYFELNAVGAWIVRQLDGRRRFDDLVEGIVARFAIDEATAAADLTELLDDLDEHGLVTVD